MIKGYETRLMCVMLRRRLNHIEIVVLFLPDVYMIHRHVCNKFELCMPKQLSNAEPYELDI